MIVLDNYIINMKTFLILNKYDECSALHSLVVEENDIYHVNVSPLSIIEESIQYYGNNLQGAVKAARIALGNISMPPVKISGKLGLYWFPSKSITHDDCIWFSVEHIEERYHPFDKKSVKVKLRNGYEITVDSSYNRFDKKVNRTHKLKYVMESRTNGELLSSYLEMKNVQIIREPNRNHYLIDNQE